MNKAVMILERQGNLVRLIGAGGSPKELVMPSDDSRRGLVTEYSAASKRRLTRLLSTIEPHQKIVFMTLTYPKNFPDAEIAKQHLRAFMKRLKRVQPRVVMIWRLEIQERGAPHFHLILLNFDFVSQGVFKQWWREVTQSDVRHLHIELVKGDPAKAYAYIAKYSSKASTSLAFSAYLAAHPKVKIGRVWGIWGKEFIMFAPYTAALVIWELEKMREFFRSVVEKLDAHLNIDREYDPHISATYFLGRLHPDDLSSILNNSVDEIVEGLIFDDLIRDYISIEGAQYSMALNLPQVLDAVEYSEIPF